MNNRILLKNFGLLAAVVFLITCACQHKTDDELYQEQISYFILDQLDDDVEYEPIAFEQVNYEFLANHLQIQSSLMAVKDSVNQKARWLEKTPVLNNETYTVSFKQLELGLDNINQLLLANARIDRMVQHSNQANEQWQQLKSTLTKNLDVLNQALGRYNLSIYSAELLYPANVIYYHQFKAGTEIYEQVFELNKETLEVLSFKDI